MFKQLQAPPALQYSFSAASGSRSNQILALNNNTTSPINISGLVLITNVDIENPWGVLGSQWGNVSKQQLGDDLHYSYTLELQTPLILSPGETPVLEYSVGKGLGPIQDNNGVVAMAPAAIQVQLGTQWQELSWTASNNSQPNPHSNFEFNNYHANWGQYSYGRNITNEQFNAINCLTYAFIGFDAQGKVFSLDSWADQLELPTLQQFKAQYPNLQPTLAFGGWTNNNQRMDSVFSQMAADPNARKLFVQNAVNAVLQAGVNGIDIDWEYVTAQDANNFIALLEELKQGLQNAQIPNPRLTIAAPAAVANINIFSDTQWAQIAVAVDRISIMAYDYYGGFSNYADFHSPMDISSISPDANSDCVSKTLAAYSTMEVPNNKLTLGIPNYSRGVIVQEPGSYACLYQEVLGSPNGDFSAPGGVFSWNSLWNCLNEQPSNMDTLGVKEWYFYDSSHQLCQQAGMCMLTGQLPNGQWVMFNFHDQVSAQQRAQIALNANLAGVMQWANYNDTLNPATSITSAISAVFPAVSYNPTSQKYETHQLNVPRKLANHTSKLQNAFFAERKHKLISELATQESPEQISDFIDRNKEELGRHRNIFKRFLQRVLPQSISSTIIGKTKSLTLAENYLNFKKIISTKPTKIISKGASSSFIKVSNSLQPPPSSAPTEKKPNVMAPTYPHGVQTPSPCFFNPYYSQSESPPSYDEHVRKHGYIPK